MRSCSPWSGCATETAAPYRSCQTGCRCGCIAVPGIGSADVRRTNFTCIFCQRIATSGTRRWSICSAPSFNVANFRRADCILEPELGHEARQHVVAQRQFGEMPMRVQDISRVIARLATSGSHIFENFFERQLAGILHVPPVDDVCQGLDLAPLIETQADAAFDIDGGHLLARA